MVLTILWLLTQPAATTGFDVAFEYEQSVTVAAGGFVVTIESTSFQPEQHKVTRDKAGWIELDGKTRYGVGHSLPLTQLSKISATYDGKKLEVDPELWSNVYNVWLQKDALERPGAIPVALRDGELVLRLPGADGAVSYYFVLHIKRDGRHWREFEPAH